MHMYIQEFLPQWQNILKKKYFTTSQIKSPAALSPLRPQHAFKVQLQFIPVLLPLLKEPRYTFPECHTIISFFYLQPIWKTFNYYVPKMQYFTPIYYASQFHYYVCPASNYTYLHSHSTTYCACCLISGQ